MKFEVDSKEKLDSWLKKPKAAIFQGQDLSGSSNEIASKPLQDCIFLGCTLGEPLTEVAAKSGCLIVPKNKNTPFDAFTPGLYSTGELYDKFDISNPDSYEQCLDRLIYESVADPATREQKAIDVDVAIFRRIHDASISDALSDVLDLETRKRTVAIMGGHDTPRDKPVFKDVAKLCRDLTLEGYLIVTGGGPGLMEAANLGAYTAGFNDAGVLDKALKALLKMENSAKYDDKNWLIAGYTTWKEMGIPNNQNRSQNIGIPTWFYGHEPPNVFATHIAKYFENSIREEGLLAIALAGVIFAKGNAGTVQEIFQDANQNYYKTYDKKQSPMVLLGVDYWAPSTPIRVHFKDQRKPVYSVIEKLACERGFADRLLLTDSHCEIFDLLRKFSPIAKVANI
jgi:predicted Rossmann-fold nucleotide-binding protein